MKEFTSAIEDVVADREREEKIAALVAEGKSQVEAEAEVDSEEDDRTFTDFKLDGREMRAYKPDEGQLTFMLAALGRGQSQTQRFASIINLMMESLRDDDQDYLESRLITRNKKEKIPPKQIEEIFEFLMEEWFANPTQSPSGSA